MNRMFINLLFDSIHIHTIKNYKIINNCLYYKKKLRKSKLKNDMKFFVEI